MPGAYLAWEGGGKWIKNRTDYSWRAAGAVTGTPPTWTTDASPGPIVRSAIAPTGDTSGGAVRNNARSMLCPQWQNRPGEMPGVCR